jgi:hypothetical protein
VADLLSLTPTPPACSACGLPALVQWRRRRADDPGGTDAVYACGQHPITLEAAALVHQPDCPAPDPNRLPACGCTPEPSPGDQPTPGAGDVPTTTLPTGWVVPADV